MTEGQIPQAPSERTLAWLVGGAFTAATVVFVLFVLPAEFHSDPTGFGRLTGIDRLAGPEVITLAAAPTDANSATRFYGSAFRSDTIEISLPPDEKNELEYKVKMKPGDTLVYSWTVTGDEEHPEWFYFDFHGETSPVPAGEKAKVAEYLQATGLKSSGALIAPFEGIHGWYVQNQSDKRLVVHLKLSGFYELIPPGEYGNEAGIEPVPPGNAK